MRSHANRSALATMVLVFLLLTTVRTRGADSESEFAAALGQFEQALGGEKRANQRAHEAFRMLSDREPRNPLFLAYYGTTFTLLGRDARDPWDKWRLTERGLDLIDRALALLGPEHERMTLRGAPVGLQTRLIASSTFLGVPRIFNRLGHAKEVLAAAVSGPVFERAPPQLRARILYEESLVARAEGHRERERELLRAVADLDPRSATSEQAQRRLSERDR